MYRDTAAYRPSAPFTTSTEWYSYIHKVTPDSLKYYLEDSFEKITLYTNKVTNATYKKVGDKYETTLEVESGKNYFDGNGKLLEAGDKPNFLDIGVFTEDDKNEKGITRKNALILEKRWVKPGTNTFTFTTDKMPIKAGIDPYNKMIDRIPDDNMKTVEEEE